MKIRQAGALELLIIEEYILSELDKKKVSIMERQDFASEKPSKF